VTATSLKGRPQLEKAIDIATWVDALHAKSRIPGEVRSKMLSLLKTLTEPRSVGAVDFSSDGSKFATGGAYRDNSIRVWDRRTWKPIARLRGHKKRITSLAFAPDTSNLVSSSADRTVAVWDLARVQLVASHGAHKKIVYHVACRGMQQLLIASVGQDGMLCAVRLGSSTAIDRRAPRQRQRGCVFL
jgi:WD40 repeat protein